MAHNLTLTPQARRVLRALLKQEGGVQINLSKGAINVATRCTPGVKCAGLSLSDVICETSAKLLTSAREFATDPFYETRLAGMIADLEAVVTTKEQEPTCQ